MRLALVLLACLSCQPASVRVSLNECFEEFQAFPGARVRTVFSAPLRSGTVSGIRAASPGEIAYLETSLRDSLRGFPASSGTESVLDVKISGFALSSDAGFIAAAASMNHEGRECADEFFVTSGPHESPQNSLVRATVGVLLAFASHCVLDRAMPVIDACPTGRVHRAVSDAVAALPKEDRVFECAFMRNGAYGPECVSYRRVRRGSLDWARAISH